MKKYIVLISLLVLLPLLCTAGTERLNYQGKLAHGNSPVTGTIPMIFQIFDGQSGTNVLYEESMSVDVVDGYYSIELGEYPNFGQLVSAIKRQDAHIQVTVNGKKLKPREKVGKPPFAEKSKETIHDFYMNNNVFPKSYWDNQIANTNFFGGYFYSVHNYSLYFYNCESQQHFMFVSPSVMERKTVSQIGIWARNITTNVPTDVVIQAYARGFDDDQIERVLSDQVRLDQMIPLEWFYLPVISPENKAYINSDEYIHIELSLPEGQTQTNRFDLTCIRASVELK